MSIIRLDNIHKSFSGAPVLEGISLRIEEGEKVALTGRNGSGKSTLFRIMTGEIEPDSGAVERMRKARIACLAQLPAFHEHETIFDRVLSSFEDLIKLEHEVTRLEERMEHGETGLLERYSALQDEFTVRGGYEFRSKAKRVLHGLGFTEDEFNLQVTALSGGQRTRLMLALVLMQDADLLLLDEPENHLDIQAREWLETFLIEWPRAFVIISHDRRMLNAVVERTLEIERTRLTQFTGAFDAFLQNKALLREQQEKAYLRQQEFIAREESWINRFRYKATKASQVQSRIKRLEKLERVAAPETDAQSASFRLGAVTRSGQRVLEAQGLSMAYGKLRLYENVSFHVERGERLGVIGPNGSGKTTLLRHLAGRLEGGAGTVSLGNKVQLGFFDQHHEGLNRASDILSETHAACPSLRPEQVRSFLGRLLFTGDDVFKPISALSGGELGRVAIARLILGGANLLLLDEPTNHLDIASREALESALLEFHGSIILISHDRVLIDKLADKLIIIEQGEVRFHLGNYSSYRSKLLESPIIPDDSTPKETLKIRKNNAAPTKAKQPSPKEQERVKRRQHKELEDLEERIESLEIILEELETRSAKLDPVDYEQAQSLRHEYLALKQDLAAMYEEWERLAEQIAE